MHLQQFHCRSKEICIAMCVRVFYRDVQSTSEQSYRVHGAYSYLQPGTSVVLSSHLWKHVNGEMQSESLSQSLEGSKGEKKDFENGMEIKQQDEGMIGCTSTTFFKQRTQCAQSVLTLDIPADQLGCHQGSQAQPSGDHAPSAPACPGRWG